MAGEVANGYGPITIGSGWATARAGDREGRPYELGISLQFIIGTCP